eukprot:scaffold101816_cov29-Tisochrysis_lutea.AAC.4
MHLSRCISAAASVGGGNIVSHTRPWRASADISSRVLKNSPREKTAQLDARLAVAAGSKCGFLGRGVRVPARKSSGDDSLVLNGVHGAGGVDEDAAGNEEFETPQEDHEL